MTFPLPYPFVLEPGVGGGDGVAIQSNFEALAAHAGFVLFEHEPWKDLPFRANWGHFDSTETSWRKCQYTRSGRPDSSGRSLVVVRGLAKRTAGTYAYGDTASAVIGALPSGYRPAKNEMFTGYGQDTAGGQHLNRIDVNTLGEIVLVNGVGTNNGGGAFESISGIAFMST